MVWPPSMYQGDKARDVLGGSSIVKMDLSDLGEAMMETHLRVGKSHGLPTKSLDRELEPCDGSNDDQREGFACRYLGDRPCKCSILCLTHLRFCGTFLHIMWLYFLV